MPEKNTIASLEKRIKQIQREGGKQFKLRSEEDATPEISEMPESLRQCKVLENLDLSDCGLTTVPEWLGELTKLKTLNLNGNRIAKLPQSLGRLSQLRELNVSKNRLTCLPDTLGSLSQLRKLQIWNNQLTNLPVSAHKLRKLEVLYMDNPFVQFPECIRSLSKLRELGAAECQFRSIPEWIGELSNLEWLHISANKLTDLPTSIGGLVSLNRMELDSNPLNPELEAASKEGLDAVKRYLRAKAGQQIALNEAKLILIGEGEVGKSCLLGALRGDPWEEGRSSTHGIEIKPIKVTAPDGITEITLNGWDFGGQRVYRPTHQLFFSAPAVYLVVWKPREGAAQGFVKEWIELVKHREPDAKIIVVATHGGPSGRQPDIDRQELWDLFGRELIVDFLLVESKPDNATGERRGIKDLREAIARVAASLPEMGRKVPKRWEDTRVVLKETGAAYLSFRQVQEFCVEHGMDTSEANDFIRISHRLGHLIHYEHDPLLRDVVILKPDWLSTAISFALDDPQTRHAHGLVRFERLKELWDNPSKQENRYPSELHPVFLRLMERFDLSYRVADAGNASLIAQLVPDVRPDPNPGWTIVVAEGDLQRTQTCRIVETKAAQSAPAEGLFYQLIVRLHKYSLGRENYSQSVHWQRGLVLEDYYGARALLENVGNDVRITVRSPYPEQFLSALTYEVKWLVENFWAGLRCDVMVPCIDPCGKRMPGNGSFEVQKLIESKRRNRQEFPCPVCSEWQDIGALLHNAPAARINPLAELLENFATVQKTLADIRLQVGNQRTETIGRFDKLDSTSKILITKVEDSFTGLMRALTDEAKDGPRLFSFNPVDPDFLNLGQWTREKFLLTLWCEHSRLPLPFINGNDKHGVYELTIPRDWFATAAPYLKGLGTVLSLLVPVVTSATNLALDEKSLKGIEKQLDLGQRSFDTVLKAGDVAASWVTKNDTSDMHQGSGIRAQGAVLRQLHTWLKEKDATFGGLVRVQNKRQEYLWVHRQFESEY